MAYIGNDIHQLAKKSSRKQTPALFKQIPWVKGQKNLDFGGGKYDDASIWLMMNHGVSNYVFDKFNRTDEHNEKVLEKFVEPRYPDTVTLANVLNVIPNPEERLAVLRIMKSFTNKYHTTIYISCYNASGQPSVSACQTCMALEDYIPAIASVFRTTGYNPYRIETKKNMLIIHPMLP